MSARSGQLRDRRQVRPKKHVSTLRLIVSITVILVFAAGIAAGDTKTGERIADSAQRFLIFYSGVSRSWRSPARLWPVLAATDRVIMSAGNRIVGQAVHRAVALIAIAFLVTHIAMEIVVGKSDAIDSVVPFLSHDKTFYVGLGTIAPDLIVLIAATGIARRSFAGSVEPVCVADSSWFRRFGVAAIHSARPCCWPSPKAVRELELRRLHDRSRPRPRLAERRDRTPASGDPSGLAARHGSAKVGCSQFRGAGVPAAKSARVSHGRDLG